MNSLTTPARDISGLTLDRVQDLAKRCGFDDWRDAITQLKLEGEPWIEVEGVLEDMLSGGDGTPTVSELILQIMNLPDDRKRELWEWILDTQPFPNQLKLDGHA